MTVKVKGLILRVQFFGVPSPQPLLERVMTRRRDSVASLAKEAGVDLDEALVRLWDVGIDEVEDPSHVIPKAKVAAAQRALGVPTRKDVTSPSYWRTVFDLSSEEFANLLLTLGINQRVGARRLPKGAVARLRREAKRRTPSPPLMQEASTETIHIVQSSPWTSVGAVREIRFLTEAEIIGIHEYLAREFEKDADPISPPGVRSLELLSSACYRPHTSLGDDAKYPTIEMAAAALLHSLALNHAFYNGNKRTALVAMLVFLDENEMQLICGENDLFRLVLQVAQHSLVSKGGPDLPDREVYALSEWIHSNAKRMEIGPERVLKWIRLKRILRGFGCTIEFAGKGNAINISRQVQRKKGSFLTGRRIERMTLHTQVVSAGDGTDASRDVVAHLRRRLWLDDEHGIDTRAFYEMERAPTLDFIVEYRKTLKRLARL